MAEYEEQAGNYPRLTYDPRTNLPLIDLPFEYEDSFGILKNTIMHWFGPVVAYSGRMRPTNRVLIISDSAIYLAQTETTMQRCWKIKSIDTLYVDEENPSWVIMKVAPPARGNAGTSLVKDPDLIADVGTPDARDAIMDIIDAVYSYLTGRNVLRLAVPPGSRPEEIVDTSKMPGWTKTLEMLHSRASLEQFYAQPQTDPRIEQAKAVAQNEFEKMKQQLKVTMSGYRAQDFEAKTREIDMYIDMLDDRDREIQRLKQLRDTIYEDANVWGRCPNCKVRQLEASANTTTKTIHSLQRQIEDAEHLLDHLQHSRAASKAVLKKGSTSVLDHHQVSESTQLIHLRQKKHELSERIIELRNIIVENPVSYPTQEARKVCQDQTTLVTYCTHVQTTGCPDTGWPNTEGRGGPRTGPRAEGVRPGPHAGGEGQRAAPDEKHHARGVPEAGRRA